MPKTMTAGEIVSFTNAEKRAVIATLRKNGASTHCVESNSYVKQKSYTYGGPNSEFNKNAKRDRRVALAIISGEKAVLMEGCIFQIPRQSP